MRNRSKSRDSGIQRPAHRSLPEFLLSLRTEAQLTQRELGAKLRRHAKFVYDSENALRRIDLGEFIEWSLACGANPVDTLVAYGKTLGNSKMAAPRPAGMAVDWSVAQSLNENADHPAHGGDAHAPQPAGRDALLTLLTTCLATLDPAEQKKLMATLPEAQKPELARVILERLAGTAGKKKVKREKKEKVKRTEK